ncbi:MAG: hypothetical protein WCD89_10610 [Anaerocolumna sp.]
MTAEERKILDTFEKVLPKLDEYQKGRLLGIGEGMALKAEEQDKRAS